MKLPGISWLPAFRRALVRVDFNVPLAQGAVADTLRIEAALPTLRQLMDQGASVALISHLGRPQGVDPSLSLAPVAPALAELLGRDVTFLPGDPTSHAVRRRLADAAAGEVHLLENLRFFSGETKADPEFARGLAALGDVFIQDAFGVVHRAHASTVGVPAFLPSAAGRLVAAEVEALDALVKEGGHPFVVAVGGAKVSDKLKLLHRMLERADALVLGGALANTFLLAQNLQMGRSLVEADLVPQAQALLDEGGSRIRLPSTVVVTDPDGKVREIPADEVGPDEAVMDVGQGAVREMAPLVGAAQRVFWNGPFGLFEKEPFDRGTNAFARIVAASGAMSVVGGGDSLAAVRRAGVEGSITHLSTGGGASLSYLEGDELPGLAALERAGART